MNKKCIHSLEKETCAYCNGLYEKKIKSQKQNRLDREEISYLKSLYTILKTDNFGKEWTEEEYSILYNSLKHISNIRSKEFRIEVYKIALQLGRTRKSIIWHYKHMFIIKNDPKAGKNLLNFINQLSYNIIREPKE